MAGTCRWRTNNGDFVAAHVAEAAVARERIQILGPRETQTEIQSKCDGRAVAVVLSTHKPGAEEERILVVMIVSEQVALAHSHSSLAAIRMPAKLGPVVLGSFVSTEQMTHSSTPVAHTIVDRPGSEKVHTEQTVGIRFAESEVRPRSETADRLVPFPASTAGVRWNLSENGGWRCLQIEVEDRPTRCSHGEYSQKYNYLDLALRTFLHDPGQFGLHTRPSLCHQPWSHVSSCARRAVYGRDSPARLLRGSDWCFP